MSELPTETELQRLATKIVMVAGQEAPETDITIEIDRRHVEITLETSSGKSWTKQYSTSVLERKAKRNSDEVFEGITEAIIGEIKEKEQKKRESSSPSSNNSNSVKENVKSKV